VLVSEKERRGGEERVGGEGRDEPVRPSSGPRSAGGPSPRPSRRSFSAEYKLAIVAEYENAPNGEKGVILRREGLYSSHVIEWTRARDAGALEGVTDSGGRRNDRAGLRRRPSWNDSVPGTRNLSPS
jgi:transposase-like protein